MPQPGPRILLIDDNKHGLIARRKLLEDAGYQVETARGGREGLEKFQQQPFDVVVTDYRMPDVRGSKVVSKIHEQHPHVPVVILSGYVEPLGLTQESTGADAVLAKGPREDRDLVRTIARLIRKTPGRQGPGSKTRKKSGKIS